MSRRHAASSLSSQPRFLPGDRQPPFVAGLLRMAYQAARRRQMEVQIAKGFSDLTQAHLSVLVYPPPDGVRPSS